MPSHVHSEVASAFPCMHAWISLQDLGVSLSIANTYADESAPLRESICKAAGMEQGPYHNAAVKEAQKKLTPDKMKELAKAHLEQRGEYAMQFFAQELEGVQKELAELRSEVDAIKEKAGALESQFAHVTEIVNVTVLGQQEVIASQHSKIVLLEYKLEVALHRGADNMAPYLLHYWDVQWKWETEPDATKDQLLQKLLETFEKEG